MQNSSVTWGDLLTAVAILISAVGIFIEMRKDRVLRQKELADRVRRSAGLIVAKADRWCQLAVSIFDQLQPVVTDADCMLVKSKNVIEVRDYLWRELLKLQAEIKMRSMEEEIEVAYADMYGFDVRVYELFSGLIAYLGQVRTISFRALSSRTQDVILEFEAKHGEYDSAILGNRLRTVTIDCEKLTRELMSSAVGSFRSEMNRLVNSTDKEIAGKEISIRGEEELLPPIAGIELHFIGGSSQSGSLKVARGYRMRG